jgi:hypothetical protein
MTAATATITMIRDRPISLASGESRRSKSPRRVGAGLVESSECSGAAIVKNPSLKENAEGIVARIGDGTPRIARSQSPAPCQSTLQAPFP